MKGTKNKNLQNGMKERSFGKGTSTNNQYESGKKESKDLEKNTRSEAGTMKKNMTSSTSMNKNTADQSKAGSNKYFSSSEKKSSSNGKNMYEDTYKKCDCNCDDTESTSKRNRCR